MHRFKSLVTRVASAGKMIRPDKTKSFIGQFDEAKNKSVKVSQSMTTQ